MKTIYVALGLFVVVPLLVAGCPENVTINIAADRLADAVTTEIQITDPRDIDLPDVLDTGGDTVIINADVTVIADIDVDVIVEELPDLTIFGLENLTGWDIYVTFNVDDVTQAVYVYDGETLLLEYPCAGSIELVSEDDIDPATGELVDSFDLTNSLFLNPDDFICGDALLFTFSPEAVELGVNVVDLIP